MNMLPVGVLGASGYAGRQLCALIQRHPGMSLAFASAHEQRGERMAIAGRDVTFVATEDAPLATAELIFSALPHGASRAWVDASRSAGARVVDLSQDLRPGTDCTGIPYGLTELARRHLAEAGIVSNPGCYPTSVLLALAPAVAAGIIAPGSVITVNSASGVTGAGNAAKRELLFGEVAEDFRAYRIGNLHQHVAEIRATLGIWNVDADVTFTPHLLPVARGILSSITVELAAPLADPSAPWRDAFAGEPFLEYTDAPPRLRDVVRRNAVRVHVCALAHTRRPMLQILSAIDNLMKGAAGQAIQNANVMFGRTESEGLPS